MSLKQSLKDHESSPNNIHTKYVDLRIDDVKVETLKRRECTKYLGQLITFLQQETTEIRNRIKAAWATFHKYRQELTSRNYLLKHRLRAVRRSDNSDDMLRVRNVEHPPKNTKE